MTVSFRTWLTLILVLVNAAVLGALAGWVAVDEERQLAKWQSELRRQVQKQFSNRFEPERAGDVAKMLSWRFWDEFEDALILDDRVLTLNGQVVPVGAFLNPKGRHDRAQDLPMGEITRAVHQATETGVITPVAGGLALPLFAADGADDEPVRWGGVFVRLPGGPPETPFSTRVLLAFAVVTVVGAGAVYFLVGRAVIAPVEKLAAAANEFGEGGQPQVPASAHTTEMSELLAAFQAMMARIRGFQEELGREVDAATARASEAERRAARQERLAAMGTLAAGLAHEINSPLAGALQGVETLRAEAHSERAVRYGELTKDALERIGGLVRHLLRLAPSRVEAGSCTVQTVLEDLPAFLESRLERHRLVMDLPEPPLLVNGSPGDLFPVMLNLVQNALDALDLQGPQAAGGEVRIRAGRRAEGGAWIRVEDDGPGADPALLPHLFEPFLTDKEAGKGTGLGLALAYATIRQLGGEIEARNRPEGGLSVELRLPAPREES